MCLAFLDHHIVGWAPLGDELIFYNKVTSKMPPTKDGKGSGDGRVRAGGSNTCPVKQL